MPIEITTVVIVFQKEVYLRFYLLNERLLHKCTEINASNFLYSHFFVLLLMEMFVLFYHCLL